ncbi:MAG: exosome complex RNA-binding protein Csl4 [Candidatus Bathyarchaeia archaeon]
MNFDDKNRESGKFVLPGERLGVIEEFIPDAGTYVKDGVIYAKVVGRALLDLFNKRVSVYPLIRGARVPNVGSIVLGQVASVQNENAAVRIFKVGGKTLSGFFTGILHVSDVQMRYVESMYDVCKSGDIMRAKVISDKNRVYHLSIKDRNLGVIYAFCSQCGFMLGLWRHEMRCPKCGKVEKRKIALDYGKGVV